MRLPRAVLAVPATMAALALPVLAFPAPAAAAESVQVALLDLNGTGATGTAVLTATDAGDLKISIRSTGMTPNSPHAQHIHGSVAGLDFHCPTRAADRNGDGYVSTEEGLPDYGDIFVSLTTAGDTTRASGLAVDRMPMADAQGNLTYERTIAAAELPEGTTAHLKDLHVVQHGIDANRNGKYDLESLGESTFAKSVGVNGIPEEATDPATCGMVTGAAAGSTPVGGVNTGDGSTLPANDQSGLYLVLGGLGLAAAAAATIASRRRSTLG